MDKVSYLKELSRSLGRWMPEREREDTLRYYTEYFEEAGPEREAQVMEELGAPDSLARRLAEEGGWTRGKTRGRSPGMVIGTAVAAVLLVAALSIGLWAMLFRGPDDSASPPGASQGQESPAPPSSAPPESGSPAPSTDPGPAQSPEPGQSQEPGSDQPQVLDAFTKVNADVAVGDVTVRVGKEFGIEVEFRGTVGDEPYRIEYEVKGGTLEIVSLPKKMNGSSRDLFGWVVVTVPEGQTLDVISVRLDVGDADVQGLSAGEIDLESDVGDVSVSDATAGSVELESDVGGLSVTNVAADRIKLESDVGDVRFSGPPAATMELDTDTGDVTVRLDCGPDACSYQLSTNVGTIHADEMTAKGSLTHTSPGAAYQLTGRTDVGNITLTFDG